ncbi:MAG: ATP-dependent helicase [Armatimonadia bacterium]
MQLNDAQRLAVETSGSVRILAAPGSGKTRTIVEKIKHLVAGGCHPKEILAISFTRAAAQEMKRRLEADLGEMVKPMQVSTFHALALKIVKKFGYLLGYRPGLSIYDERDQRDILMVVIKDLNVKKPGVEQIQEDLDLPKYAKIKAEYRDRVRGANALDYDMLIEEATKILGMEAPVERYQHILIDEFQDLNGAQYAMARALMAEGTHLCAVLDVDQAIMEFQGASIRYALRLPEDFPGIRTLYLDTCYRCPTNVLDAANKLILHNRQRLDKPCRTDNPPGEIEVRALVNELEEGRWIAEKCLELHGQGMKYADMAVLARTHRLKNTLHDSLKGAGVPVNVCGRSQEFFRQPAVVQFLDYLRVITNPHDAFSFRRVLNFPNRGLTYIDLLKCESTARAAGVDCLRGAELHFAKAREVNPEIKAGLEQLRGWAERCVRDPAEHRAVLNEIAAFLAEHHMKHGLTGRAGEVREAALRYELMAFGFETIGDFLEHISEMDGQDDLQEKLEEEKPDQVNLMTCHVAKGLEFPVVFIPGMEQGGFPIGSAAKDAEEIEQERRLFYVAVTRSERHLYLTRAVARTLWAGEEPREPSVFLGELGLEQEA